MKKLVSLIMCLLLAFPAFSMTGCGKKGEEVDPNRTQVYVGVLTCGVGFDFAYSLKAKYEAIRPDIQVMIDEMDSSGDAPAMKANMPNARQDILFMVNYTLSDFVTVNTQSSNLLADITDIVTEVTDGGSIHSKMYDGIKSYHNVGTESSPKYYSLPWYSSYGGTVYDVDLFEEKNLYNLSGYKGLDGIKGTEDDCWGPDGVQDTYDDGLPATWEDMKVLLTEMKSCNVTPFTWTSYEGYLQEWMSSVWASYEGKDNYSILQDFDGMYKSSNADDLVITEENGYQAAYQNGKLAALTVLNYIMRNGYYDQRSTNASEGHLIAQQNYLESVETDNRIAFLLEGNWWEKEAKDYFDEMAATADAKYAYGTRKFGYFPWPKFIGSSDIPDQVNTNSTLVSGVVEDQTNCVVVNKASKHLDEAKALLKFAYSDAMNADFTMNTGMCRPFDYQMTDTQLEGLTYYQRSVWEVSHQNSVEKIAGANRTGLMRMSSTYIENICAFLSKVGPNEESITNPATAFQRYSDLTAKEYFDGVKKVVNATEWNDRFFSK